MVVLKPSETSPDMAALISELLPMFVDSRSSGTVGKITMEAAELLTPVALELGGKAPAFDAKDANIDVVNRRLAIGKFFSGQSFITPGYLIVERIIEGRYIKQFKKGILDFYDASVQTSHSYSRIVNKNHFQRLIHEPRPTNDVRYHPYNQNKLDWGSWFLYDNVKYLPNASNPGGTAANKGIDNGSEFLSD
ncbi:Aldehyde dehydrogenase, dimeric NADP-preferring [Modicella reniformis]|uniref:Aldehyde dehydrogenase, dimeric NADP-preferring n=1 Tax=Modicella reniformis TaxID=1440133 RepID=A0A9P6LZF5_9FUNG|nr:Aldehyde dehydrogenase, dimeric NADP-preferring [Modicella reniformis]